MRVTVASPTRVDSTGANYMLPTRAMQATMRKPMALADVQGELAVRGGLLPLMHLFPNEETHPGLSIPWTAADQQLQRWLRTDPAYQAAAAELAAGHLD